MKEMNAWVIELNGEQQAGLFAFVTRATSKDECRQVLCGTVFVDRTGAEGTPDACVLVATCGRRIHAVRWDEMRLGRLPEQGVYKFDYLEKMTLSAVVVLRRFKGDANFPGWRKCIDDMNWSVGWFGHYHSEKNLMSLVWKIEAQGVPVNVDYLRDAGGVGLDEVTVVCENRGNGYLKLEREDGLAFAVLMGLRLEPVDAVTLNPPKHLEAEAKRKAKALEDERMKKEAERAEAAAEVYEGIGRT